MARRSPHRALITRIAGLVGCDPRTVARVLAGESVVLPPSTVERIRLEAASEGSPASRPSQCPIVIVDAPLRDAVQQLVSVIEEYTDRPRHINQPLARVRELLAHPLMLLERT